MAPWRLRGYGAVLWYVIFGVVFISEEQIVMEAGRVVVSGIRRALVLALPWFGGWGAWAASDGAAATDESELTIRATQPAEVLLFDLA